MYSGLEKLSIGILASLNLEIACLWSSYKKPLVKVRLIFLFSPFIDAVSAYINLSIDWESINIKSLYIFPSLTPKALNESGWRGTKPDGRAIFEVTELSLSIKSSAFEVK